MNEGGIDARSLKRSIIVIVLYYGTVATMWWIATWFIGDSWRKPAEIISIKLAGGGELDSNYNPIVRNIGGMFRLGIVGLPLCVALASRYSALIRIPLAVVGVVVWLMYIGMVVLDVAWKQFVLN